MVLAQHEFWCILCVISFTFRPVWAQYPDDTHTYSQQNQYLLGSDLLVHPVIARGQDQVHIYLPGDQV